MLSVAITISFVVGVIMGFMAYFACRMGYKEISNVLKQERSTKKRAFSTPTK